MATELRRFTISITPNIDDELDVAKKEKYYKTTQTEMIRDLILRGLSTLNNEATNDQNEHQKETA